MLRIAMQVAVAITLWGGLAVVALGAPERAAAVQPCPNTDCIGPNFCEYLAGTTCKLSPGKPCSVAAC